MLKKKISLTDNKSARQLALEDKETVNAKPKKLKRLSRTKCGISNPCIFGAQSPIFEREPSKRQSL